MNEFERAEKAEQLFKEGYNCAQSVSLAFADIYPALSPEQIASLTSGFGGGMGRIREVCGAFSACVFVSGMIAPAPIPNNLHQRTANYSLVQDMAARFKELNGGSIICRELLGFNRDEENSPIPSERTKQYYEQRPCSKKVYNAALLLAQIIKERNIL